MRKLLVVIVVLLIANTIAYGQDVNAYIELLRSADIKTRKIEVIKEVMDFTEEESSAFWPVYRKYEFEIEKIFDEKIDLIKDYVQNYDNLTDEKASELAMKTFELQKRRTKLMKKYFKRFERVLPSTTAAKFLMIERSINLMRDVQIISNLPLIK
ncbi:MAG: hypothetical protein V3V70_01950 [Candidatus Scalindua sp.]